jgi:hypothetical protein
MAHGATDDSAASLPRVLDGRRFSLSERILRKSVNAGGAKHQNIPKTLRLARPIGKIEHGLLLMVRAGRGGIAYSSHVSAPACAFTRCHLRRETPSLPSCAFPLHRSPYAGSK